MITNQMVPMVTNIGCYGNQTNGCYGKQTVVAMVNKQMDAMVNKHWLLW